MEPWSAQHWVDKVAFIAPQTHEAVTVIASIWQDIWLEEVTDAAERVELGSGNPVALSISGWLTGSTASLS